mgnify:CR=1 FL=1
MESAFNVAKNIISLNLQRVYGLETIIDDYRYINLVVNKQELQ